MSDELRAKFDAIIEQARAEGGDVLAASLSDFARFIEAEILPMLRQDAAEQRYKSHDKGDCTDPFCYRHSPI